MTITKFLIKGAQLATDEVVDILIEGELVSKVAPEIVDDSAYVIDAAGLRALSGLVDLHTHLREPGREDSETAASGLVTLTNTTDAGPLGTAAVVMSGGLSVAKQINVGLQDITAHVDFTSIAYAGVNHGLVLSGFCSQAQFLMNCGILDLMSQVSPNDMARYAPLAAAAQKLLSPAEMGDLFKVIALSKNFEAPLLGFASGDKSHTL